jgi:hypothetical protein
MNEAEKGLQANWLALYLVIKGRMRTGYALRAMGLSKGRLPHGK